MNLEYLARVVEERDGTAFPDTLVGTDSHTTMINGLGVLGWGVGGIEAEAAMLGEPISMLVPQVVGFKLMGELPEGATATDLVLTVTEILREAGVVGKFVEYYGHGLERLPLADRATIGNMSPEYGATCGFFPVDDGDAPLPAPDRAPEERVALVEAYCKENALWHDPDEPADLLAGRRARPLHGRAVLSRARAGRKDRVPLREAKAAFLEALPTFGVDYGKAIDEAVAESFPASDPPSPMEPGARPRATAACPCLRRWSPRGQRGVPCEIDGETFELEHGSVVIAAITSCTNTSNPAVMVGAGLLAKKAVERGLKRKPWVKSSLAPGSKVVTEYYDKAGLTPYLEGARLPHGRLRLHDLHRELGPAPGADLGRGRRGRPRRLRGPLREPELRGPHPRRVKANYLASPPLVVAYALAGRMDVDLVTEPIGVGLGRGGRVPLGPLALAGGGAETVAGSIGEEMFRATYADVFTGDETWRALPVPEGELFAWDPASTYVRRPPYFDGMPPEPGVVEDIAGARCLVWIGDSVTTDHISPAGAITPDPRRAATSSSTASSGRTSTRTAPGAATTRSWCGARSRTCASGTCSSRAPRERGRRTCPPARRGRSSTSPSATAPRARRSSCSRARSTAPARRATGRPRGRTSSASGR